MLQIPVPHFTQQTAVLQMSFDISSTSGC